jgi:Ca2+-binding RTX toxin-like protein
VGAFTFSAVANLTGGTGLDVFKFSAGKNVTGSIDGGGGGDWLDYALYTTPVSVNLSTGSATGVGGTVANIQDVRGDNFGDTLTGNSAGNILIGGTGADTISGGTGASILIGDKGADNVTGGSGNDIIIGGWTNDDASSTANDLAIEKILAEWQSGNPFAARVSNIKTGGGLTGGNKLVWASTVHDDLVANTLTGLASSTTNWFFEGAHDTITDPSTAGQIN